MLPYSTYVPCCRHFVCCRVKVPGHCAAFSTWCWDWHYDAGAYSIMSYVDACNKVIHRRSDSKQCNKVMSYGPTTVSVTDIPETGDLWGTTVHHAHDAFMGDDNNNPARALRETGPIITNYRKHGCKWWGRSDFTNGEAIGGVWWYPLTKDQCSEGCQSDGLYNGWYRMFNEACAGAVWDSNGSKCLFFRNKNLQFVYKGNTLSAKRKCWPV